MDGSQPLSIGWKGICDLCQGDMGGAARPGWQALYMEPEAPYIEAQGPYLSCVWESSGK